jgi:hypothetical protein
MRLASLPGKDNGGLRMAGNAYHSPYNESVLFSFISYINFQSDEANIG